jgi:hypothetical protein
MFSSVVADNLHLQSSGLHLTIISILDWLWRGRRRVVIQSPTFGRTSPIVFWYAIYCIILLSSNTTTGPSEQTHAGVAVCIYRWTVSRSGFPWYVLSKIVRISEGTAHTQVTVGVWGGIVRAGGRIIEVGRLAFVSARTASVASQSDIRGVMRAVSTQACWWVGCEYQDCAVRGEVGMSEVTDDKA